jgi:signal transduction histidine kinase
MQTLVKELVVGIQNALQFQQIQNFNLTLQHKVDDATRQLRHANQRLKALDETKDDFISMASHQLRTPLTSVKGYLSMVLDGDAGKLTKMQHDMLHQAFSSSQRMVYLISDRLNVSRLKTGKFVIESTPVNLADIIVEEMEQLKESAAARQVKLEFERPAKFPDFMLDDTKIRQVIMNFMDNAVYYTRPGGTVTISLDDTEKKLELRVKDNGIGVPKAEQYRLFTKFYRAGNARKVRPDGTGLGLFMAKKVVVAQGGAIIFDSQEGKGSTFGFSFDKSKVLVPAK